MKDKRSEKNLICWKYFMTKMFRINGKLLVCLQYCSHAIFSWILTWFAASILTGIALMTEGFMSAFYHICPSNSNFQFGKCCSFIGQCSCRCLLLWCCVCPWCDPTDTAFMFIIGGLLIVKILQARHPAIHSNAFIAFFSFAVVIFMTLLAIVCNLLPLLLLS